MKSDLLRLNDSNRRDFMLRTAKSVLGVSLLPGISAKMAAAEALLSQAPALLDSEKLNTSSISGWLVA